MTTKAPPVQKLASSLASWARAHRWPLALFCFALIIRLHWNLVVHPPLDYNYSDMHGYVQRADQLLADPFSAYPYAAFYPFGTSWLIAAVKYLFGAQNETALAAAYALWGSLIIPLGYGIAFRVSAKENLARATAVLLSVYYPLISLGGYTLSEVPASLALCLSLWLLLRLWEQPRRLIALALGLALGVACTIRTQVVLYIALLALFWLYWRRKDPTALGHLRFPNLGWTLAPLLLILALSSWRVHYHSQEFGLISQNGPINLAFGRCHLRLIAAKEGDRMGYFSPPPVSYLISHSESHPRSWIQALPVFGDDPRPVPGVPGFTLDGAVGCKQGCPTQGATLEYEGYIGDTQIQKKIVRACLERSSWGRQLYFSLTHVVQLWAYSNMWPDASNPKPRPLNSRRSWRKLSASWQLFHGLAFAIPALFCLPHALRQSRSHAPLALVALAFLSLLIVAALVMGGIRFRTPYDPIIIILALWQWQRWYKLAKDRWQPHPKDPPDSN